MVEVPNSVHVKALPNSEMNKTVLGELVDANEAQRSEVRNWVTKNVDTDVALRSESKASLAVDLPRIPVQ